MMTDIVTVKDANGRQITVRRLKTIDRMRLLEMVGAENALNDRYLGYATLAFAVSEIDGDPVPRLTNKIGLEGIVTRLDDVGFEAIGEAVRKNFLPPERTDEEVKDLIKNE
jgi:hypothetical protein